MKLSNLLSILILFFCQTTIAQNRPEEISTDFFKKLKTSSKDTALVTLYKNLNPSNKQITQQSIKGLFIKIDSIGKLTDWLWICDMELTKDLILKSFLLKYDQKPIRLDMLFYKKENIWYIQNASIEEELFSDLKNAGRSEKIRPNNLVVTY